MFRLDEVNRIDAPAFTALLGGVYEHSPWIAERAFALRPAGGFASRAHLHAALVATVHAASEAEKLALLEAHPELAGKISAKGYGASKPKATNTTAEGREMNRRVEITVKNLEALKEYSK